MNGVMHTTAWGVVSSLLFVFGVEGFIIRLGLGKGRDQGVVDWGAAKIVFFLFVCVSSVREGEVCL